MTVQELIDELMKVEDKSKVVVPVVSIGISVEDIPFVKESRVKAVVEGETYVELMDEEVRDFMGEFAQSSGNNS